MRANWLYSGKVCCIRAKGIVFGQSGCICANVVIFRTKVTVFGQKLLYSGNVVVFGQSGCIRAKEVVFR